MQFPSMHQVIPSAFENIVCSIFSVPILNHFIYYNNKAYDDDTVILMRENLCRFDEWAIKVTKGDDTQIHCKIMSYGYDHKSIVMLIVPDTYDHSTLIIIYKK